MRTVSRLPRPLLLAGLLLLLAANTALAQNRADGTIYSRFGLGALQDYPSSQIVALGGGGYAMRSLNYVNFSNPAAFSDQVLVRVAAGASYRSIAVRDGSGRTGRLSGGSLTALHFGVPLLSRKLGIAFGLQPYSRTNYRVRDAGQLSPPADTIGYTINRVGQGGLQQISGGFGYRFNEKLSVGANVHYIFGTVEHVQTTTFDTPGYVGAYRTHGTRLSGVTGTVGALFSLTDVLASEDALSIGAAFTLPTTLYGDYAETLGRGLDRDTLATADGSVDLPWKLGLGVVYHPDARWTLKADGTYAPWSTFESRFPRVEGDLPFFGGDRLADRMQASLGVEYIPAGNDRTDPYLQRVAYRLGAFFESGYVRVPDASSTSINTYALTGGFSFPTRLYGTRLDVNFRVGTRGTTANGLVRDVFYGVSVTVNIGEQWFQRRKLR